MLVGTGTVLVDDPQLTVRDELDQPVPFQPLRAVMGLRDLPSDRRVLDDRAETVHLRTREPAEALDRLFAIDRQHVFLEGGPTLARAFLDAGLVDEVVAYVAPMLLGAGTGAVADLGITTIADARHLHVSDVHVLPGHDGEDTNVRLTMTPMTPGTSGRPRGGALNVHRHRRGARHRRRGRRRGDAIRLTVRADTVLEGTGRATPSPSTAAASPSPSSARGGGPPT